MTRYLLALLCILLLPLVCLAQPQKPRLDDHGFPLPDGAIMRLGDLHFAQRGGITAIALSSDDKIIATGGSWFRGPLGHYKPLHNVCLWDADTGRILREIFIPRRPEFLAFAKCGRFLLVTMDSMHEFLLVEVASGKIDPWLRGTEDPRKLPGSPAFAGNDRFLTYYTYREVPQVQVWDRITRKRLRAWQATPMKREGERGEIDSLGLKGDDFRVVLSPSGETMAWLVGSGKEGNRSNEIHLYDTITGKKKGSFHGPREWSPRDGWSEFALLDEGETFFFAIKLQGVEVQEPDGTKVRAEVGGAVVIDARTGRQRLRIANPDFFHGRVHVRYPTFEAVSPDGQSLYTKGSDGLTRWNLATGKKFGPAFARYTPSFVITSDSRRTIVAKGSRLYWCDPDLEPLKPTNEGNRYSPWVQFLPDGRLMSNGPTGITDGRSSINIWDLHQRKIVATKWLHDLYPERPYTYLKDNSLVILRREEQLAIYNCVTGREVCRLKGIRNASSTYYYPEFCADGSRVLVPFEDGDGVRICWYDSQTGRQLGNYFIADRNLFPDRSKPHSYYHRDLPAAKWYASDGSTFGYVMPDSRLALVDCATCKVTLIMGDSVPLPKKEGNNKRQPAWEYQIDGEDRLIVGRRTNSDRVKETVLYDQATGMPLRRLMLPWHYTAISPDGRFVLTDNEWGDQPTLRETATGRPRGVFGTGAGFYFRAALSADGKMLAVGCQDTSILIWDLDRPLGGKPDLPLPKSAKEAEPLWELLGHPDPIEAEPAIWALRRAPKPALAMLQKRLQPAQPPDSKQLQTWIAQLDSESFKVRETANQILFRLGEQALPALHTALKKPVSLEQHLRLHVLIERITKPPQPDDPGAVMTCLRELRALEVLERIGGADARRLVERVAGGDEAALRTREARLILARWQ